MKVVFTSQVSYELNEKSLKYFYVLYITTLYIILLYYTCINLLFSLNSILSLPFLTFNHIDHSTQNASVGEGNWKDHGVLEVLQEGAENEIKDLANLCLIFP